MELINGTYDRNKIILIYGTEGVGKTTICGKLFKKVAVADIEDGAFNVDCLKTPHLKSLNELRAALRSLVSNDEIDTIAIDSLTAIEKLAIQVLCKENKVDSLNELAFGKGFDLLKSFWKGFMDELDAIKKKKNIILIGHETIKRHEDPRMDGYDKILLQVYERAIPFINSRCDAVLYMTYELTVIKNENGMYKDKAAGQGKRIIYTQERPAFIAKNRFNMPATIKEKDFGTLPNYIFKK